MKKLACAVVASGFLICASAAQGRSVEDYVAEASRHGDAGELKEAVELLAQALQEHPASSDIHAHLGLYTGMSAGRTADYMEAGRLSARSFELLDKAVSLDPRSPQAYLFRGIMGVRVPKFLGRLDEGINDLTKVVEMHRESPEAVSLDTLVTAYTMLADGHALNGDAGRARAALQEVINQIS